METNFQLDGPVQPEDVPKVLPRAIANAIVRVYEDKYFSNLHVSTKQVLSTLIRFGLNLENVSQFIFIKKSTIAEILGINEATVYRALSKLEEFKLIEREAQNRTYFNLKVIGKIRITKLALEVTGVAGYLRELAERDAKRGASVAAVKKAPNAAPNTSGEKHGRAGETTIAPTQDVNVLTPYQSLQKQSGRGLFKNLQGKTVPVDLAGLVENQGMSLFGLLQLMKLAKASGKRLSDVVQVCRAALDPLTGRELYAYLRTLIGKDCDYSHIAAQRAEDKRKAAEAAASKKLAEEVRKNHRETVRGKSYVLENGNTVRFTDLMIEFYSAENCFLGSRPYEASVELVAKASRGELAPVNASAAASVTGIGNRVVPSGRKTNAANAASLHGKSFKLHSGGIVRFAEMVLEFISADGKLLGSRPYAASKDIVAMASAGELLSA